MNMIDVFRVIDKNASNHTKKESTEQMVNKHSTLSQLNIFKGV